MPLWIALYVVTGMHLPLGRGSKGAALLVVVGVRTTQAPNPNPRTDRTGNLSFAVGLLF